MNKMGRSYSKAAVAAFILAVLPPAVFLLIEFLDLFIHLHSWGFNQIYAYAVIVCGALSICIGIVLAIVGLINSFKHNLKGKGFAIASLIILFFEAIIAVMVVLIAVMRR